MSAIFVGILMMVLGAVWLKLRGPDIPYPILEEKYADGASRFVDLPGGFHVHYTRHGDPALPLLVLLHGFGDSVATWEGWVALLASEFHLISVDFPGHGLTRAPTGYELEGVALADFVDSFASQLMLPNFALAGNSMGGAVAWEFAVRHPARLAALILLGAAGFPNDEPAGKTPLAFKILRYPLGRALLCHIDYGPLIETALKKDVYDESLITPVLVARWAALQRAPGHRAILLSLDLDGLSRAAAAPLHDIKVPTLILQGDDDPLVEPASAHKFAAAIPGSRLLTYSNVGHLPQIEIPQRSAADVAAFLAAVH